MTFFNNANGTGSSWWRIPNRSRRLFVVGALACMALIGSPIPDAAHHNKRSLARTNFQAQLQEYFPYNSEQPQKSSLSSFSARAAGLSAKTRSPPQGERNREVNDLPLDSLSVATNPHVGINLVNNNNNNNNTRKVVFVHVGKAGGNTVRAAYPRFSCRKGIRKTNLRNLAKCYRLFRRNDSPFSQQCDWELHLGGVNPTKEMKEYTTFLYALRNPIARAISAYSYLHHNNTGSPTAQTKHYLKDYFYRDCFPTLQHLLRTLHNAATLPKEANEEENARASSSYKTQRRRRLVSQHTKNNDHDHDHHHVVVGKGLGRSDSFLRQSSPSEHPLYCQSLAIAVLRGRKPLVLNINVHLRDNYQFYYRKTIKAFPRKEVLVVRTENIWNDLQDLDIATGGSGVFKKAGFVLNENVKTKNSQQDDPTPAQLKVLCCILWEDIRVYQRILNLARNLPYQSKLQTMEDVWSTCGIDKEERVQYSTRSNQKQNQHQQKDSSSSLPSDLILFSWSKWQQDNCPSFQF